MLAKPAQLEMGDLKDRFGNFDGESIGHQQWPADILAKKFQPTKDIDVPPDNTEIETIARANIAVGGNAVVQSDIDGNMLLNLRWCALECRQCCPRCSQGQLTGWRGIVARNGKIAMTASPMYFRTSPPPATTPGTTRSKKALRSLTICSSGSSSVSRLKPRRSASSIAALR